LNIHAINARATQQAANVRLHISPTLPLTFAASWRSE
jgi:hypothetical protein